MTGAVYLQMLQNWLKDELIANEHEDFFVYLNRTVLHLTVRAYLNDNLPGCADDDDNVMLKWPPRSPNPLAIFSLGICEKLVYAHPFPKCFQPGKVQNEVYS